VTKPKAGRTPEQKVAATAYQKARRVTPEQKAVRSNKDRARYATPEGQALAIARRQRRKLTPEQQARRSETARLRYANPETRAASRACLLKKYGLTIETYDLILAAQDGRCAICQCVPRTRRLAVDHCHKTNAVRGLLCTRCNHKLLGAAHDKPEILDRAAAYLRHPPAPQALLAEEGTL
jgi:Recombination endonuclease VII